MSFSSILTLVLILLAAGCEVSVGNSDGGFDFGDGDGDLGDGDSGDGDSDGGTGDGDGDTAGDGDSGDGDGDTNPGGIDPEDFSVRLAEALCTAQQACIGAAPLARLYNYNVCADVVARQFAAGKVGLIADSAVDGRVVYDPAGAVTCIDEIANQGCAWQSTRPPASCKAAIEGQAAEGADCNIDFDCAGDAYCAGDLCPGTCTARVAVGGVCGASSHCVTGSVCDGGICIEALPVGSACDPNTEICEWGNFCDGTCQSDKTLFSEARGDACDIRDEILCDNTTGEALTCQKLNGDLNDSSGTCQPSVLAGEPCVLARPDQCPIEQYCLLSDGLNGTCVPREQTGGVCAPGERKTCADGLVCVTDTCHPRSANGQECFEDARCDSGTCNLADDVCEPAVMCP